MNSHVPTVKPSPWRIVGVLALLSSATAAGAPAAPPSLPVTVSLLTMTPGDGFLERYGHSAIVVDDGDGKDPRVYNFGVYDDDDPALVGKFMRHALPYRLAVWWWSSTQTTYAARRLTLQTLALDDADARRLSSELDRRAWSDDRYYRYEALRDNCSTRARDVLAVAAPELRELGAADRGATFRALVARQLGGSPLIARAMDLVLNREGDRPIHRWEETFLPVELESLVREARRRDGQPLVARERFIDGPDYRAPVAGATFPTDLALAALLLLGLAAAPLLRRLAPGRSYARVAGVALAAWGLVAGTLGTLLLVSSLMPYSDMRGNTNLSALHPLMLALVPLGIAMARCPLSSRTARRARFLLALLALPVALDVAACVVGLDPQRHLGVLLFALAADVLALVAVGVAVAVAVAVDGERSTARLGAQSPR